MSELLSDAKSWFALTLTNRPSFSDYLTPFYQLFWPSWRADKVSVTVQKAVIKSKHLFLEIKPKASFGGFKAGQFVELTAQIDGRWLSRCFTISSSPQDFENRSTLELGIKIQEDGTLTKWLSEHAEPGLALNISEPEGGFLLPEAPTGNIIMIAGGSGITPFRSMIRQLLKRSSPNRPTVQLYYYAPAEQQHWYQQELEAFAKEEPSFQVKFINSQETGHLSQEQLREWIVDVEDDQVMVCGPTEMIQSVRKLSKAIGLGDQQVHYEFFGPAPVEHQIAGERQIFFAHSNKQIQLNEQQHQTLLQIAEEQNLNPVSGCRAGICHQCICKKTSGVVLNTLTGKESDPGEEEIQLCISVPVTNTEINL